jgi:hypothetical protein
MTKLEARWLAQLEPLEEEWRQYVANLTDTMEGLADKIRGLTWEEIYQLPEIKALQE